ncbi:MAG: T9SS type A sorting domain-containing protein, partial [Bacteroidota bacterium]
VHDKNKQTGGYLSTNGSKEVIYELDSTKVATRWVLEKIPLPKDDLSEYTIYQIRNDFSYTYLTANDKLKAKKNVPKEFELRAVSDSADEFNQWVLIKTDQTNQAGDTLYNIDNLSEDKGMMFAAPGNNIKWVDLSPPQSNDSLLWEVITLGNGCIRISRPDTALYLGPNAFDEIAYFQDTSALVNWRLLATGTLPPLRRGRVTNLSGANSNFKVYPVPSYDGFIIIEHGSKGETFEVCTLVGRRVHQGTIGSSKDLVNLSHLASGAYLLKTRSGVRKIILP